MTDSKKIREVNKGQVWSSIKLTAIMSIAFITQLTVMKFTPLVLSFLHLLMLMAVGHLTLKLFFQNSVIRLQKSSRFLVTVPLAAVLVYGWVAFVFPFTLAEYVVPGSWEWPVSPKSSFLTLRDGKTAVALKGAPRIQVYDAEGRYMGGWFVPDSGGLIPGTGEPLELIGESPDPAVSGGEKLVFVQLPNNLRIISFSLTDDHLTEARDKDEKIRISESWSASGAYRYSWYEWPLLSPLHGWLTAFIGFIGLWILYGYRRSV